MPQRDDDQELRAKLDALGAALERRRAENRAAEAGGPSDSERAAQTSAISRGYAAAGEFAGAIAAGGLLGWLIDRGLGTTPAFLIAFFLLGGVAGVVNLIRAASAKTPATDRNSRLSGVQAPDKDGRRPASASGETAQGGADDDED